MRRSERVLLASIHDVSPRFTAEIERLAGRLTEHLGGPRFAMLVVPDHWGSAPIAADARFQRKLRGWADSGVEMFVHGWYHREDEPPPDRLARFKARHMTAGEGEFLGLDRADARRRMCDGKKMIEDILGRPVVGFVAPAWLYGPGALAALADADFALAEDHLRVWRPRDGSVVARGPVVTWASRSRTRIASSIAFARLARLALRPMSVVRVAVHPGDAHVPELLESIDLTFRTLGANRRAAGYAELAASADAGITR